METKAERLAQARKKLRDYQSKQRIANREDASSPSPSVSSFAENGGRQSAASLQLCNHDEAKSAFRRVRTASQGSPSSPTQSPANQNKISNIANPKNVSLSNDLGYKFQQQNGMPEMGIDVMENSLNFKQECIRLREELALRTAEKGQLSSQLTELIGHYSQIHAAYTKLSECIEKGDPSGSALQMQLVHLQTAMSVVVKEKTALQQQLRQKNELIADRNKQTHSLTTELKEKTSHITLLEAQITSLRKEIDTLSNAMERQRKESENGLKEAINWQAKVLRMQQDRDDAQERLKICMKEAEAAQAELDEARKQLRMKDIYLRQLGAYTGAIKATENDAQNFGDQIEHLKNELAKVTGEAERWKKEAQLSREHYESYGTQLNQNIVQMSTKLEEVSNEKLLLEAKVQVLENQIEMLQMMGRRANSVIDDNSNASVNLVGLQEMQDKLTKTADDLQKAEQLSDELKEKLMIKEQELLSLSSALSSLKSELIEKNTKLADVEESLARARSLADEQQKHTEGALSLSEQLQNEKATVSRAIAQNHELKEQLIELQDKLVVVTQESMERESGRLSALHMVAQLRNELNRLNAQCFVGENVDSSTAAPPVLPNGDVYELQQEQMQDVDSRDQDETVSTPSVSEYCDRDVSLSHTENAHTHAELELVNVKMALEELRLEHRRVVQENEELRRIMEQNSEDENQNNIHVELGQAVDRISTLSVENEQLRNDVSMLQEKLQSASLSNSLTSSPSQSGTLHPVQLNGNTVKQLQALPIAEKPLAWTELEARFTRAMQQIADLVEEKERLQHIVMQLETENDTIGDYVTLYQHQRKKINERMREREEAVAKLSFEKEQMQRKLTELQETLIHLLSKRGLLHVYGYEKGAQKGSSRPSKRARAVRSYSHSTADEFCGDEETVVDGTKLLVPESPDSYIDLSSECDSGKYDGETSENKSRQHDLGGNADDDVGVQRILNLISELQDLERARTLPPCSPNLHCSECRGKLINL